MSPSKKPIAWGNRARLLRPIDICRGTTTKGKKQDLRGWIIEFFGENTQPGVAFERHLAKKIGILSHGLEIWSDTAIIKEQVRLFNETLEELKVLGRKRRSKK